MHRHCLPERALTNIDLIKYTKKVPHFRGVFMRNSLPKKIHKYESGIINLDSFENKGTHWTAYKKNGSIVYYFDSFGNLKPPKEVVHYFKSNNNNNSEKNPVIIKYNHKRYQKFNAINCGHLCLEFLYKNVKSKQ